MLGSFFCDSINKQASDILKMINHNPNLIETFVIDSPAPVQLSGVFETVEVLQDSFITFAENTTLGELKADEYLSVEVIKPTSLNIKVAPTQMKESEQQLDDTTRIFSYSVGEQRNNLYVTRNK